LCFTVVLMCCCTVALLWYCNIGQLFSCTVVLLYCCTVVMCCCTILLLYCCVVALLYCCVDVLLCWCNLALFYCCNIVPLCSFTVVLLCFCSLALLCCCNIVQLCSCTVVLLYCCAVLLKDARKIFPYLLHFSVSINFGTLDNHRLLSHYEFHENRRRAIEVIPNVVAMYIVGVRENSQKMFVHCEFNENEQREGRMLPCRSVRWRVQRVTVWELRTACSETVQHLSLFWLPCSLLMKLLSDGLTAAWLSVWSVCHCGQADRRTFCPCVAALDVSNHGRTGEIIYKLVHFLTNRLSPPFMYSYIFTLT